MKRRYIKGFSAIALLLVLSLGSTSVGASSLNFVPSNPAALAGNPVTVDVFFSDPGGLIIGTFDLFLNYDPNILTFDSSNLAFGLGLGGPADSLQYLEEPQPGSINVAELSFVTDLTILQDGVSDLLLFSVTFDTGPIGTSSLGFGGGINSDFDFLGDEGGNAVALDTIGTGSINVVPIPASLWLMGCGIVGLLGFQRKRRQRTSI